MVFFLLVHSDSVCVSFCQEGEFPVVLQRQEEEGKHEVQISA